MLGNNKKSQVQTTETVFVIFIIIIIIILAIVFYSKAQEANLKEIQREARLQNLITLAHTISNWPELECSFLEVKDYDCIDRYKLDNLADFIAREKADDPYAFNYYSDLLRKSTILINEIYSHEALQEWMVYNNSANSLARDSVYVPVNIFDPTTQRYTLAIMEIRSYE